MLDVGSGEAAIDSIAKAQMRLCKIDRIESGPVIWRGESVGVRLEDFRGRRNYLNYKERFANLAKPFNDASCFVGPAAITIKLCRATLLIVRSITCACR